MSLTVQLFGGSLSLSGWPVLAALAAVAWLSELAVQGWSMRADR